MEEEVSEPSSGAYQQLYANGVAVGHSNADAVIRMTLNNSPKYEVHLSFSLAKTLSIMLSEMIENLETNAAMEIKTTKQIDEAMGREQR